MDRVPGKACADGKDDAVAKKIANLLINDLPNYLKEESCELSDLNIEPASLAKLAELLADDSIGSKQGKEVFAALLKDNIDVSKYVEEHGTLQKTDSAEIEAYMQELMDANMDKVEAYRAGKTGLQGFFMGQLMKKMAGQGNPKVISEIVARMLQG